MSLKQPTSLVKFTDAEAALRILGEGAMRWSAPCRFSDPFELDHHSTLNFDTRSLLTSCVKSTLGLIFSRDDPKGNSPLIKAIRRWRTEDRFDSEEEAQEVLTELLTSMVQHQEPEILDVVRAWKDYSSRLRILCLSENHDNVSLWERYGDAHRGVAIRFACGDETSMENPQQVRYTDTKPEITPLAEQMDILMNQARIDVLDSFEEKFLNKSKLDAKEKEWRLFKTAESEESVDDVAKFEDIPFGTSEVRAIYFGTQIEERQKQELLALAKRKFQKAKIFQAEPMHNRFEFDFQRLES